MHVFFLALQGRKIPNVRVWDTGKHNCNISVSKKVVWKSVFVQVICYLAGKAERKGNKSI